MTKLRRGFKTEANGHALAIRRELQLADSAPLSPWKVAESLSIPTFPLSELARHEPEGVSYLLGDGRELFSAVTIFGGRHGRRRVVWYNDAHAEVRQAADLAHELAHAILGHPPTLSFTPNPIAEEEAKWLGPTLLVPNEAALRIVETNMALDSAARHYGVSTKLLQMRINVSGARIRVQRRR